MIRARVCAHIVQQQRCSLARVCVHLMAWRRSADVGVSKTNSVSLFTAGGAEALVVTLRVRVRVRFLPFRVATTPSVQRGCALHSPCSRMHVSYSIPSRRGLCQDAPDTDGAMLVAA